MSLGPKRSVKSFAKVDIPVYDGRGRTYFSKKRPTTCYAATLACGHVVTLRQQHPPNIGGHWATSVECFLCAGEAAQKPRSDP